MSNPLVLRAGIPFFIWLAVYHQSVSDMVTVWGQSKTYEHGYLILPISLWLVWTEKEKFKKHSFSTALLPVFLIVIPSFLWLVGRAAGIALFEHVAAVLSLQLLVWAILGNQLARAFFFPIFFLSFCIPFGEELIPYLQSITADISVTALRWTGIPVYREGWFLTIPNGQFQVAEACSGIRFLISSIALGTLFAYMFFGKLWKQTLFIAFSCMFPIIANGIRAYGIVIIAHLTNMEHATGADHLIYGWVFFSIVIATTFGIAILFSDKPANRPIEEPIKQNCEQQPQRNIGITLFLVFILSGFGLWEKSITTREFQIVSVPLSLPEQVVEVKSSLWGIVFPRAQESIRAITADGKVELYSARYSLGQKNGELISSENQLFDKDTWSLSAKKSTGLTDNSEELTYKESIPATQLNIVNAKGESMKVLYWYCINGYCSNSKLKLKLLKAHWLISGKAGYADIKALASPALSEDQLKAIAMNWVSSDVKRK